MERLLPVTSAGVSFILFVDGGQSQLELMEISLQLSSTKKQMHGQRERVHIN